MGIVVAIGMAVLGFASYISELRSDVEVMGETHFCVVGFVQRDRDRRLGDDRVVRVLSMIAFSKGHVKSPETKESQRRRRNWEFSHANIAHFVDLGEWSSARPKIAVYDAALKASDFPIH